MTQPQLRHLLIDGQKSIALEQYPDSAWNILSGESDARERTERDYFKGIPWLRRAVDLRATAVAAMPFGIYRGEKEIDSSVDYNNAAGFLPNPARLFWLLEASLTLTNRAYLFKERNTRSILDLRYLLPTSVVPKFTTEAGLDHFIRYIKGQQRRLEIDDIVYFWTPDPYVEIGPSHDSPAKSAAAAAGVLWNVDAFASAYFQRGAIKATILTVSGTAQEQERRRLEDWWNQMLSGIRNAFRAQVINADAVKPVVVGDGIEGLHNQTLTREKREDIATALGIPQTLLFSDASTNATALLDQRAFLQNTIVPQCGFIAEVLNVQALGPMGLRIEFQPETLDAFQEDEHARSGSLLNLVNAGMDLVTATQVLGFELTPEQEAALRGDDAVLLQAATDEMRAWHRYSGKRLGKEARPFVTRYVPDPVKSRIEAALPWVKTQVELAALFGAELAKLPKAVRGTPAADVTELVQAIREATKALAVGEAAPVAAATTPFAIKADNMTIEQRPEVTVLPADMTPIADAINQAVGEVREAVGKLPKPQVNITVPEAKPADINIVNKVNLPKKIKTTRKVKRDKDRLIVGTEDETTLEG